MIIATGRREERFRTNQKDKREKYGRWVKWEWVYDTGEILI